jgi:hypothetical protein
LNKTNISKNRGGTQDYVAVMQSFVHYWHTTHVKNPLINYESGKKNKIVTAITGTYS